MRIAIKDRGRPARSVNALEVLAGEPAHPLANLWLLRPGHIIGDVYVAGGQKLAVAPRPRSGAPASKKAKVAADSKLRRLTIGSPFRPLRPSNGATRHNRPIWRFGSIPCLKTPPNILTGMSQLIRSRRAAATPVTLATQIRIHLRRRRGARPGSPSDPALSAGDARRVGRSNRPAAAVHLCRLLVPDRNLRRVWPRSGRRPTFFRTSTFRSSVSYGPITACCRTICPAASSTITSARCPPRSATSSTSNRNR